MADVEKKRLQEVILSPRVSGEAKDMLKLLNDSLRDIYRRLSEIGQVLNDLPYRGIFDADPPTADLRPGDYWFNATSSIYKFWDGSSIQNL